MFIIYFMTTYMYIKQPSTYYSVNFKVYCRLNMATCTSTAAQKNNPQEVKQQEDKIPIDISLLTVCVGGGDAIFITIKYSESMNDSHKLHVHTV